MEQLFTPEELLVLLGQHIRHIRIQQTLTQEQLAHKANISLNAVKNLESGNDARTSSLIAVVRALGKEDWLNGLAPVVTVNPLQMVRTKPARQRVRRKTSHG